MTTLREQPGDRSAEAPLLLTTQPPRTLSFGDQAAFWANLGVSLIGFAGAFYVLQPAGHPQLPVAAAVLATAVVVLRLAVLVPGRRRVHRRADPFRTSARPPRAGTDGVNAAAV